MFKAGELMPPSHWQMEVKNGILLVSTRCGPTEDGFRDWYCYRLVPVDPTDNLVFATDLEGAKFIVDHSDGGAIS